MSVSLDHVQGEWIHYKNNSLKNVFASLIKRGLLQKERNSLKKQILSFPFSGGAQFIGKYLSTHDNKNTSF